MRTEPPRPPATSFASPVSSAISLSRPTSAPASVTGASASALVTMLGPARVASGDEVDSRGGYVLREQLRK
jgi:hypothetical protein